MTQTRKNTLLSTMDSMHAASQHTPDAVVIPSEDVMKSRLRLEFEELLEKAVAMGLVKYFYSTTNTAFMELMKKGYAEGKPYYKHATLVDTHIVNLVEVLDACCDQRVVNDGTIAAFGFHNTCPECVKDARCSVFHTGFARVHDNNMTKFPTDLEIAEKMRDELAKEGIVVTVKPSALLPGRFALIDEHGKYRKYIGFKGVYLDDLIPKHLLESNKE